MKSLLSSLLLICSTHLSAQNNDIIPYLTVGDTISLTVVDTGFYAMQWQRKVELLDQWEDIEGSNTNDLILVLSQEDLGYNRFRLKFWPEEGSCFSQSFEQDLFVVESHNDLPMGVQFGGGILYYRTNDTLLICHPEVLGNNPTYWGCDTTYTGLEKAGIGDGVENTQRILELCADDKIAARLTSELVIEHYDDWYLPAIDELELLVQFGWDYPFIYEQGYWSSTYTTSARIVRVRSDRYDLGGNIVSGSSNALAIRMHNSRNHIRKNILLEIDSQNVNKILAQQIDKTESILSIRFNDEIDQNDEFIWSFEQGKVISGSGTGPYDVAYTDGNKKEIQLQIVSNCDTLFYSTSFFPQLAYSLEQDFGRSYKGIIECSDVNLDGHLDLFNTDDLRLMRDGRLYDTVSWSFPRLNYGDGGFGDLDNDGYPDLVLCGLAADTNVVTKIFKNVKGEDWQELSNDIPGVHRGFIKWFDFNKDGNLDLFLSGLAKDSLALTKLFIGDGTGSFEERNIQVPDLSHSGGDIADYDADGDSDLVITGFLDSNRIAIVYRNDHGKFVDINQRTIGLSSSDGIWEDFNNDGILDFVLSGEKADLVVNWPGGTLSTSNLSAISTTTYKSVDVDSFELMGMRNSAIDHFMNPDLSAADFDNDGKSDLLIAGTSGVLGAVGGTGGSLNRRDIVERFYTRSKIALYSNRDSFFFNNFADLPIFPSTTGSPGRSVISSKFACSEAELVDFNRDGRIDIIREGGSTTHPTSIYLNSIYKENFPPQAPEEIQYELACDSVTLNWQESTDDLTPSHVLTYDIYIGSEPGKCDIVSKANDYELQVPWFKLNRSLPVGIYYWSVRAKDNGLNFSDWAPEQSITIGFPTSPTIAQQDSLLISDHEEGNQWHDQDGPISGATDQEFIATQSGLYYSVVTKDSCWVDTTNVIDFRLTSTRENDETKVEVFPNPFNDVISLKSTKKFSAFELIDMNGRSALEGNIQADQKITLKSITRGSYNLKLVGPSTYHPVIIKITRQ